MEAQKRRVKRGWMNLKVTGISDETHDTKTLHFADADEGGVPFDYIPGQYLTFRFDDLSDKPLARSYSFSSSPRETDRISVTVKEIDDGFVSKYLVRDVNVGDVLRARGPLGRFYYDPDRDQDNLVMIAAGSGVTPFISAAREFAPHLGEKGYPKKMSMLVGFRTEKDIICRQVLDSLEHVKDGHAAITLSREESNSFWHGRIDGAKIDELLGDAFAGTTYLTCGPTELMNAVGEHLRSKGVAEDCIKTESFD